MPLQILVCQVKEEMMDHLMYQWLYCGFKNLEVADNCNHFGAS